MKRIITTLFLVLSFPLLANEPKPTSMATEGRIDHRITSLGLSMQAPDGKPTMIMGGGLAMGWAQFRPRNSELHNKWLGPWPHMFGGIRGKGDAIKVLDTTHNSVSTTVNFDAGGKLSITGTRLSHGLHIATESGVIRLFAKDPQGTPKRIRGMEQHWGEQTHPYSSGWSSSVTKRIAVGGSVAPLRFATGDGKSTKAKAGILGSQKPLPFPERTKTVKRPEAGATSASKVDTKALGSGWMLLWYGKDSPFMQSKTPCAQQFNAYLSGKTLNDLNWPQADNWYQADVPLLCVFSEAPKSISYVAGKGVEIQFGKSKASMVIAPLNGLVPFNSHETEAWLKNVPREISQQSNQWTKIFANFANDIKETVNYDKAGDTVTFKEETSYLPVRKAGEKYSPVPAMVALAKNQGAPVKYSAEPIGPGVASRWGHIEYVKGSSYSWSIKGLGDQVFKGSRVTMEAKPSKAFEDLQKELNQEVEKVVAAGHLAPGLWAIQGGNASWANPAESLQFMALAMPYLTKSNQDKLKAWLKKERAAYPPETLMRLPHDRGARREGGNVTHRASTFPGRPDLRSESFPQFWESRPHIYRAYGLSNFYEAVGEKPSATLLNGWGKKALGWASEGYCWDTGAWFAGKHAPKRRWFRVWYLQYTSWCVNRDIAGLLGLIRMHELAGSNAPVAAWKHYARLMLMRFGMETYSEYMFNMKMVGESTSERNVEAQKLFADASKVSSWTFMPVEINHHNVTLGNGSMFPGVMRGSPQTRYRDMAPEMGIQLKTWGAGDNAKAYLQEFNDRHSNWYASKAEASDGNEHAYMYPCDSHQLFLAHALIAGTDAKTLARYIDVPWMKRGDLYYIHKLVETLAVAK